MKHAISPRVLAALEAKRPFSRFLAGPDSPYPRLKDDPRVCDFALGNPHEMPLPEYAPALRRWSTPRHERWFTYTLSRPEAQACVAATLRERTGLAFEPADVAMTNGAFGGLATAIHLVAGGEGEVVFMSPPWFNYEAMITAAGATPVRVRVNERTFDLDVEAITRALTPKTCAVIVNSPNNPTGRIYPVATLKRLAQALEQASERGGRPVYLISDESYNRIVYDGRTFPSPTGHYPYSFLVYTYGKTLLTPGQRLGYLALPPTMPEREVLRSAIEGLQVDLGWLFPNATLQYALADLEPLSIDVGRLERRRDRLVGALRGFGYETNVPEGTFYVMVRSPLDDDWAFAERLAREQILVLPGSVVEMPGWLRLSLTASDDMLERALPGFERALGGC